MRPHITPDGQFGRLSVAAHRLLGSVRFRFSQQFADRSRRARITRPVALLLTLLQRTPAERLVVIAHEIVAASPLGAVLRATALTGVTLGVVDSMAGATTLDPTVASPAALTTGTSANIGFTVTNTINIGSWLITGTVPPGLSFTAREANTKLQANGLLDATSPGHSDGYGGTVGGISSTTPILSGTPTVAGNYTLTMQAFEFGAMGGLASNMFSYTITVADAAPAATAPTVSDPAAQTVTVGGSISLSVTVGGSPTPTVQWQKDGVAIAGATGTTYSVASAQTANAGSYTAVATNSAGTVTSHSATVTVNAAPPTLTAPSFSVQPTTQTIATGNTVVFNATVTDATGVTYQWQHNGAAVAGATSSMLMLSGTTAADAGTYAVVATNSVGTTTSNAATLSIVNASAVDTGHLSNLSVRTFSGINDQVLNVGFTVGGDGTSGNKALLLRVVGPTLGAFGVGGTMTDPMLTVQPLGSTTVVAANDNWGGDTTVRNTSNAVGAFAIGDSSSADAALVTSLAGGVYTAIAAGKNNGTGIVITEIYDATPSASFTATTPRLINVSARAQAGTGDNALIVGFTISGSTSRTVLIRATGPALAAFGVGGTVPDPMLQVFQLGGPKLYENDNWGGSTTLRSTSNKVGAFGIADGTSKDAVLLVTLPPGTYTAQVSGVGSITGIALVEVYDVP